MANNSTKKEANDADPKPEAEYVDYCSLSVDEIRTMATGTDEDRKRPFIPVSEVTKEEILRVETMGFAAETMCVLFLAFIVPNGIFTLPPTIALIGKFLLGNVKLAFSIAGIVLLPLAILPQAYVPTTLQSFLAIQVCKYFSFRFIVEQRPSPSPSPPDPKTNEDYHHHHHHRRPGIFVAPPHGVFPYGNILSMLGFPALFGQTFRGLASSAALRPPIFKQVLRSIGVVDASRHVARNTLEGGESIGISTGGVAEIFFTNEADECILLKERVGLVKLAIRTGSDIVPCYLFGNTELLNCWSGEGVPGATFVLEKISRKLGFALILIYGRFFLPIPFRKPILAVMGRPIHTHHVKGEDPTPEQVKEIQTELLQEMERIFDTYKPLYGWDEKKLIIK
eukprot:jgi/Psemu1/283655/fgenesh1_pg.30_\